MKDVIIKLRYIFIAAVPLALYLFVLSIVSAGFSNNSVLYQFLSILFLSVLVILAVKAFSWNKNKIVTTQGTYSKSKILMFRIIISLFFLGCMLFILSEPGLIPQSEYIYQHLFKPLGM